MKIIERKDPNVKFKTQLKQFILLMVVFCFLVPKSYGQDKLELGLMLGSSSYMGDLNPVNPFYQPNFSGAFVGRYVFNDRVAFKTTALATSLRGSYPSNGVWYPKNDVGIYVPDSSLSYSFNRPLVCDVSAQIELNFQSFDHPYVSTTNFTPYVAIGLGTTIYKRFSDSGTKDSYKPVFVLSLPVSVGVKYRLNKHVRVGLDWTFRKVFASDLDQTEANSSLTPSDPFGFNKPGVLINNDWISTIGFSVTFNMWPRKLGCSAGYKDLKD